MNDETSSDHHVAWKDRIGFNKVWFEDFKAMSETYGTPQHPMAVRRTINDIVNIKNGPSLSDLIEEYSTKIRNEIIEPMRIQTIEENKQRVNSAYLRDLDGRLEIIWSNHMSHFIKQLWEDHGFGFYESRIEEDDVSLN